MTLEFEAHVRSVLASGCSARQARDNMLLNGLFLLAPAQVPTHTQTDNLHLTPFLTLLLTLTQTLSLPHNVGNQILRASARNRLVCQAAGGTRVRSVCVCFHGYRFHPNPHPPLTAFPCVLKLLHLLTLRLCLQLLARRCCNGVSTIPR
jgi:hypothetical protein